ncbi:YicC/YloC family endoribonuclease [Pyrinomonas sp.]|uniref:YicC/YloC family endoribonuclease n=1 Tax=Pyrinomonas sp. TaxID=2080306 RepID=UPI0033292C26
MKSMTGYGRGQTTSADFRVTVELKTVNNRFLDLQLRASAELTGIETVVRQAVGARLARGRVEATITFERTGEIAYEINRALLAGILHAMREVQKEFTLTTQPDINALVRLPGVLQPVRASLSAEEIDGINRALAQALDELDQMRVREGEALKREMLAHLAEIERLVPVIEDLAADQVEIYRARLQRRVGELLARSGADIIELDQARLAQEVAYLAERSDITEEVARLKSHLAQFRALAAEAGEVGKKLDFLLQELNREANTILSKTTDIAIKEAGLAIKAEIEKLREQAQNVE